MVSQRLVEAQDCSGDQDLELDDGHMNGFELRPAYLLGAVMVICVVLLAWGPSWFIHSIAASSQPQIVHLSNADRYTVITVSRGAIIDVKLSLDPETGLTFTPHGDAEAWTIPVASDGAILKQLQGSADHSTSAAASFKAEMPGTSTILSSFPHPEDALEATQQHLPDFEVTVHVEG